MFYIIVGGVVAYFAVFYGVKHGIDYSVLGNRGVKKSKTPPLSDEEIEKEFH